MQIIWNSILLDILRQRTHDVEVKKYCITLLEKLGSFRYTRNVLESLDEEARAEVIIKAITYLLISLFNYIYEILHIVFVFRYNDWAAILIWKSYLTNYCHGKSQRLMWITCLLHLRRVIARQHVISNQRGKEGGRSNKVLQITFFCC